MKFVRANRAATGRAPDAHGRFHGAVFYLSPKFTALKSVEERPAKRRAGFEERGPTSASYTKKDASLSAVFNRCLVESCLKPVAASSVVGWMSELFGKG
jgi:hypothetical protein